MKHILNAIFEKIINEIELSCVCVVLCLFWFAYFWSHFEAFFDDVFSKRCLALIQF